MEEDGSGEVWRAVNRGAYQEVWRPAVKVIGPARDWPRFLRWRLDLGRISIPFARV